MEAVLAALVAGSAMKQAKVAQPCLTCEPPSPPPLRPTPSFPPLLSCGCVWRRCVRLALSAEPEGRRWIWAVPAHRCMSVLLETFGAQALPLPLIAQALPPIFANAKDRKVREEACKVAEELYRCGGRCVLIGGRFD
jgi:hypothetical protein